MIPGTRFTPAQFGVSLILERERESERLREVSGRHCNHVQQMVGMLEHAFGLCQV